MKADVGNLEVEWQKFLPGIVGKDVVQDYDGGYLVLGTTASVEGTPPTYVNYQSILVKTDVAGNVFWTKTYLTDEPSSELFRIIKTSDGGYALGGHSNGSAVLLKINPDGDIQWSKHFLGNYNQFSNTFVFDFGDFIQTSDGGYAIVGSYPTPGSFYTVYRLLMLITTDAFGNLQWNKTITSYPGFTPTDILQKSDGYAIMGGQYGRPISPYFFAILKIDSNGLVEWYKIYGGGEDRSAEDYFAMTYKKGIATRDGGYLLAGSAARYGGGFTRGVARQS